VSHEKECLGFARGDFCICTEVRAAYQRGYIDATAQMVDAVDDVSYQRGYTAGYNDHARTVQHWQDTHGAYRQHGQGENP
jgi:hypothetical protein